MTKVNETLWPDEREKNAFSSKQGGRRRGIGYDLILKAYQNPRKEFVLGSYRSDGSGRVSLHNLREKLDQFPVGLWYLRKLTIEGEKLGIKGHEFHFVTCTFYGLVEGIDRPIELGPVQSRLTIDELEELRSVQKAVKDIEIDTLEDQIERSEFSYGQ